MAKKLLIPEFNMYMNGKQFSWENKLGCEARAEIVLRRECYAGDSLKNRALTS
jgi:hypothetical protein